MALQSQLMRGGMSRRNMVSRRRRPRRWPWALLVLLVVAITAWFLFSGDGESASPRIATADTPQADADASSGDADQSGGVRQIESVRDLPDPEVLDGSRVRLADQLTGSTDRGDDRRADAGAGRAARDGSNAADDTSGPRVERRSAGPGTSSAGAETMRRGLDLIADGKLVEGRRVLSDLLFADEAMLSRRDAQAVRDMLTHHNDRLMFSGHIEPGDPLVEEYRVQRDDLLSRIAPRYKLTYQFLERINGIDAHRIQVGQAMKLVRGPFHARVVKSEYRMDVYLRASDGSPIYVRSFDVGLGESDSTPLGDWVIEPGRKVTNPDWRNPRTGDYYRADDPDNPIGDHWLALKGTDDRTAEHRGYGIHGTVEPDSIGRSVSMGCIRLGEGDIDLAYQMLVEGESTVQIVP